MMNYEAIAKVEEMLTELKKQSMIENNLYGLGVADKQIKAILATLEIMGLSFVYEGPDFTARIYQK